MERILTVVTLATVLLSSSALGDYISWENAWAGDKESDPCNYVPQNLALYGDNINEGHTLMGEYDNEWFTYTDPHDTNYNWMMFVFTDVDYIRAEAHWRIRGSDNYHDVTLYAWNVDDWERVDWHYGYTYPYKEIDVSDIPHDDNLIIMAVQFTGGGNDMDCDIMEIRTYPR